MDIHHCLSIKNFIFEISKVITIIPLNLYERTSLSATNISIAFYKSIYRDTSTQNSNERLYILEENITTK